MIGYLQGEILEHADGKMLIGVGNRNESGTVGYSVSVPQSVAYELFQVGAKLELFVYTHVREEYLDLYGFNTKLEKSLFLTLLGVNGIGPKSALSILSGVDTGLLIDAIIQGDQAFLTKVPGIGKKTAERVVVELRDTIQKKLDAGTLSRTVRLPVSDKSQSTDINAAAVNMHTDALILRDAKDALVGLGYRDQDIHQLLSRLLSSGEFRPKRAEELVRTALRQLA